MSDALNKNLIDQQIALASAAMDLLNKERAKQLQLKNDNWYARSRSGALFNKAVGG